MNWPAWSHCNSYIFYEMANSYDLTRTIFAKKYIFYKLPIRLNLYKWPTPNPAPKPTRHWGLVRSYELATS